MFIKINSRHILLLTYLFLGWTYAGDSFYELLEDIIYQPQKAGDKNLLLLTEMVLIKHSEKQPVVPITQWEEKFRHCGVNTELIKLVKNKPYLQFDIANISN